MRKIVLILGLVGLVGCAEKKHNITFNVEIDSTKGENSLAIDCFKADDYKGYMKGMNDVMNGRSKTRPEAPRAIASYITQGKPQNKYSFTLDLPEQFTTCIIDKNLPINITIANQSAMFFKPTGAAELNVKYNMFASKLFTVDSKSTMVELAKN
jgi:hypothetical protein